MSPQDLIIVELVPLAASVRERGRHYAGFKVGCIGYYVDGDSVRIFKGANAKRTPTTTKICAEKKVLRAAAHAGVTLDGLIILGLPRAEDVAPTLHPCEVCRKMFRRYIKKGKAIQLTTQVICVSARDKKMIEHFTVAELFAAHGE